MTTSADQLAARLAQQRAAAPPRPRCRGCGDPLDPVLVDREDNTGLHMSDACYRAAERAEDVQMELTADPVTVAAIDDAVAAGASVPWAPGERESMVEPPSTVAELHRVLIDYDASRPRSMQVSLGPSELGTPCQAQMGRKLAGAPRRPVTAPAWAPIQGTAMHAEMELILAFWNEQLGRVRWLAEDELQIDDEIRGHGDAYDLDHDCVDDWKYVGTTALKKLRAARRAGLPPAEQVSPEYRVQGHLYGVGHERKGRPVKFVRLVLLARSWQFSDSDEWTEEYQPEIAYRALDRYYATKDLLTAFDVANNPHLIGLVPATPSADTCKWCPFHDPTRPSGWDSCQGYTEGAQRATDRFATGLIAP